MRAWRRILAVASAALLTVLSGCHSATRDAAVYVKGRLDTAYLGTCDRAYLNVAKDMTETGVQEEFERKVRWEAALLVEDWLPIDLPTGAVYDRAGEVITQIYSHAKYTVANGEELENGGIAVEVTVSPIEIIPLLTVEFQEAAWLAILDEKGIETQEQMDSLSDGEYQAMDEKYALILLDKLEDLIGELTYGEDQVITLRVTQDSDGCCSLADSGIQKLDEVMIDYYGAYVN